MFDDALSMARAVCLGDENPPPPRDYVREAFEIVRGERPGMVPQREHLEALADIIRRNRQTIKDLIQN